MIFVWFYMISVLTGLLHVVADYCSFIFMQVAANVIIIWCADLDIERLCHTVPLSAVYHDHDYEPGSTRCNRMRTDPGTCYPRYIMVNV